MVDTTGRRRFLLFLVKPAHYDDDGYVIQWARSALPSNSLACLYALATDAAERQALGEDVDIEIFPIDETNTRVRPERIAGMIKAAGGCGMVGMVGVQSNQFPHAMDLARPLRAAGILVCIGGFHVSGSLAMLPETHDSLKQALALGISLFAGEAEGRFDDVLRDAAAGALKPIYNFLNDLPNLDGAPFPLLPAERVGRTIGMISSFDAGRGCPFLCSFCTIINVQGRKSRYRSADDIERSVRANHAQGVRYFLITDDNLARNRNWEAIFDRLIALRREGIRSRFVIQVDTMCHKIPGFIEKAGAAGVNRVFIGLENINPDSLVGAGKKQNHIADYREMLQAWRKARCVTYCGYILGFPGDTPETIERDIKIIQRELPLDILEFSCLTPLPGSEDHQRLTASGASIDPDLNKFDLEHVVTDHPTMSREAWQDAYRQAWRTYYTEEHIVTVIRRAAASGMRTDTMMFLMVWFWASMELYNIYPLESGILRRKVRRDRRPGLPIESAWTFYPRYVYDLVSKHLRLARMLWKMFRIERVIARDPKARDYTDAALRTGSRDDYDSLEMFQTNDAARKAGAKAKRLSKAPASDLAGAQAPRHSALQESVDTTRATAAQASVSPTRA